MSYLTLLTPCVKLPLMSAATYRSFVMLSLKFRGGVEEPAQRQLAEKQQEAVSVFSPCIFICSFPLERKQDAIVVELRRIL